MRSVNIFPQPRTIQKPFDFKPIGSIDEAPLRPENAKNKKFSDAKNNRSQGILDARALKKRRKQKSDRRRESHKKQKCDDDKTVRSRR